MENYFAGIFEDVRHGRSLILVISLTDPEILKQVRCRGHEIKTRRNLALAKIHKHKSLKEYFAMQLLDWNPNINLAIISGLVFFCWNLKA